ncbi:uncharacterized protein LOC108917420 isoform X2 [Anoplophora glabripennis]|uniref:uncharacterized protein LOC108917420 isoform X1 n=1 Tax=Anoplophora glabripennis TaxID=217634 RepID=UPI000874A1FB|nr:uncharacterized protein LOC108917420 isoform X1 [Anoplophora glabripennis]XP_018579509.1 uncharacterized protein LOC108917420 isoform X2 [Anoplophora glabripennis]
MGCMYSSKSTEDDTNFTVQFHKRESEEDHLGCVEICNRREYFDEFDLIYEEMVAKGGRGRLNFHSIRKSFCIKKKTISLSVPYPSFQTTDSRRLLKRNMTKWLSYSLPKEDCSALMQADQLDLGRKYL